MKILLANKFYYLKGGAERYFFNLKDLLGEKGYQVIPFSMQDERNFKTPYEKYFVSNVDIEKPKFSLKSAGRIVYSFEAARKLEELIKNEKPNIAHLHNIYHQISPSILTVLKKHKIPIVMTLHDFKILCPVYILYTHGEICERCKTYRYWQCVLRKCAKNSYLVSKLNAFEMYWHKLLKIYENNVDLFIAPSQFLKNKILEWGRLPENKVVVIPHFVENGRNLKIANPNNSENYILYFGRLSQEKGVDILLQAIKILKKAGSIPIKFYLAGSGPQEWKLKEFVKSENLQDLVKFLGYLGKEELRETIKNSLFTVMPSVVYESFGLAILESYQAGKPVLASNLGALPELVKEEKTGTLFKAGSSEDLAKKIILICQDENKLAEMGGEAEKLVQKKYNKELHWRELKKIYKNLL
jgi:glycosyltransferase involved in cell wall biosynthesis